MAYSGIINASLIIADGAYHCPVGSIWPFLYSTSYFFGEVLPSLALAASFQTFRYFVVRDHWETNYRTKEIAKVALWPDYRLELTKTLCPKASPQPTTQPRLLNFEFVAFQGLFPCEPPKWLRDDNMDAVSVNTFQSVSVQTALVFIFGKHCTWSTQRFNYVCQRWSGRVINCQSVDIYQIV